MPAKDEDTSWIFNFSIEHRDQPEVSQEMIGDLLIASKNWAEERGLRVMGKYYGESEFAGSSYKEMKAFLRREIKNSLRTTFET